MLKELKLLQLDKVLYGGGLSYYIPEGKPVTVPMTIEKAKFFYNEMKITVKCRFSEVSNIKLLLRT